MAISVDLINLDGSTIPSEYNMGVENSIRVNLKLTVTSPHTSQVITGNVKKNGTIIAKFDRTSTGILTENWFGGARQPIYVNNGDVLEVSVVSPLNISVSKNIFRGGDDLIGDVSLPSAIEKCKYFLPGEEDFEGNVINEVIRRMSVNSNIKVSNSFATNLGNIEKYVLSEVELPPITINIFDDPIQLQGALDRLKPVTQKDIFDTWPRFVHATNGAGQLYWDNPANATGDAKAWQYNVANQRVTMPLNTATWNGFVSQKKYDRYDHEVTVGSPDGDDDWNGIIIGHVWHEGINKILGLTVSTRNNATVFPGSTSSTILVGAIDGAVYSGTGPYVPSTSFMLANVNDPSVNAGWSGREKRIKVVRRGDLITIDISAWNSTSYDPVRRMVLDLNEDPKLAIFKGPQSYGYWNFSQANTYFKDIFFDGGERADTITYGPTGEVYTYSPTTGWVVEQGLSLVDIYGAPRALVDATTGKIYRMNEDGSIDMIPVRRYENSPAWSGGASDLRQPWEITNPVTGSPLSFQNIGYSIINSVVSNPDGYRHTFFSKQRLKEGEYRVFCHVDDVAEVELTGPQGISLTFSRRDSTDITIIQGGVFDVEVVCENISGLMWWSIVLVSLDTGEIYYWPDEHNWTSSEGTIHYD